MSIRPRRLGKYELQTQLGHGGTAEVWKALDTQLQRYVAIKLLYADLQEDPQFVSRFEREAQLIASLHHPNIVQVHDFQVVGPPAVENTIAYMVMEYIEGPTLADYIESTSNRGHIPPPEDIVQLFTSIGLAIDYAHSKGLVHRDIKPANILLDQSHTPRNPMGEPILTDFGVAKILGTSSGTLTSTQLSTPLYISPEQVRGYPGNERSDLYALGVILYEMVTGILPFRGDDPTDVMAQHLNVMPVSPASINPRIPPALTMVIMRSLAKDPAQRFPSATSLVAALADSLNIAVPESLGKPAYPIDPTNMPTVLGPLPDISLHGASAQAPASTATPPGLTPSTLGADASARTPGVFTPQTPPVSLTPVGSNPATPALSVPLAGQTPPAPSQANVVADGQGIRATPVFTTSQVQAPPGTPAPGAASSPPIAPVAPVRKQPSRLLIGLIALLVLALLGGLASFLLFVRPANNVVAPPANAVVGHAFFTSSGQLHDGAQGIADQMQIDLQNVAPAQPGKSYYAWLLADKAGLSDHPDLLPPAPINPPILLTNNLPVTNGSVDYFYHGDAQHNNLISATSRFLITEEDAGRTPPAPSTDRRTWIYYAELPQSLIPNDPTHLRGLDHIRHLFYNEDHLKVKALYGGLDIWLFRNTEKILEWSTSARDDFNPSGSNSGLMRDLFIEILDYLDGSPNVHLDLPPSTPVLADTTIAQISILTIDKDQANVKYPETNPPGYLAHIPLHVSQTIIAPGATPEMKVLGQEIVDALNNVNVWLTQVRMDAKTLFNMSPQQLSQPAAREVLDDMVTQATYAYIGQLDPVTNKVKEGVLQAHYAMDKMATFDITRQVPSSL